MDTTVMGAEHERTDLAGRESGQGRGTSPGDAGVAGRAASGSPTLQPEPDAAGLARSSGWALAARIAMGASRGVGLILITRALGSQGFGDYSLLITAFAIASTLGAFGVDQAHVYFAGSRRQDLQRLLRNAFWMASVLGGVAGSALLGGVHLFRSRIFDTTPTAAVLLTALCLPAILYQNYLQGVVIGRAWFRYYSLVEVGKWLVHAGLLSSLAATGSLTVFTALLALYAPVAVAGWVHLVVLVRAEGSGWRHLPDLPALALAKASLAYGMRACSLHVTQVLHLRLDVYVVKYFTSSAVVGQYALALNVADVILYLGRSVGLVVFAKRSADPAPTVGVVPRAVQGMLLAVGGIASVVFLLHRRLIDIVFGPAYAACAVAVACRLPGIVAESVSLVLVADFLGRARTRAVQIVNGIAVGAGFLLDLAVVPLGGATAAATVFSVVSWMRAAGLVRGHARMVGLSWRDYVLPRRRTGGAAASAESKTAAAAGAESMGDDSRCPGRGSPGRRSSPDEALSVGGHGGGRSR